MCVYGDDLLTYDLIRIQGIIFGVGVKPKAVNRLKIQPDVLAIALDLIGIDDLYQRKLYRLVSAQDCLLTKLQIGAE